MAAITGLSHLTNPLATPAQLHVSSSQLDGVPVDLEDSIRYEAAKFIQAAGILLRLPQDLVAEAIVIFTRFWIGSDGGSLIEYGAKVGSTISIRNSLSAHLTIPGHRRCFVVPSNKALRTSDQSPATFICVRLPDQSSAKH